MFFSTFNIKKQKQYTQLAFLRHTAPEMTNKQTTMDFSYYPADV